MELVQRVNNLEDRVTVLEQKCGIRILPEFMNNIYPEPVRKAITEAKISLDYLLHLSNWDYFDPSAYEKIKKNLDLRELYKIGGLFGTDSLYYVISNSGVGQFCYCNEAGGFYLLKDVPTMMRFFDDEETVPELNPLQLSWLK